MHKLADQLRRLLPPNVGLGLGNEARLWPGEELPNAVPSRLAEFAQGRAAARAAMCAAGIVPDAIPMGPDRAPIWPTGVVGSISHCTGACMAIASKSFYFQGIGLDLEPAVALPSSLWETVLRPEEQHSLDPSSLKDGLRALQIFVAKEAAYKAQYAISRELFDFQTLSVSLSGDRFTVRFERGINGIRKGREFSGRLIGTENFQLAFCCVER